MKMTKLMSGQQAKKNYGKLIVELSNDPKGKLNLGQETTEIRVINHTKTCIKCKKDISPQMMVVHFETFKTNKFESCGIVYPSVIAWRVCGFSHLNTCD